MTKQEGINFARPSRGTGEAGENKRSMPNLILEVEDGESGYPVEFAVTVREHSVPYRLQFMLVDDAERVFCRSVTSAEIEAQIEALLDALAQGTHGVPSEDDIAVELWAEGGPRPRSQVVWCWLLGRMLAVPQPARGEEGSAAAAAAAGTILFRTEAEAQAVRRNAASRRMGALSRTDGGESGGRGWGGGGGGGGGGLAATVGGHERSSDSLERPASAATAMSRSAAAAAHGHGHGAAAAPGGGQRRLKEHQQSEERFRMNADLENTRYTLKLQSRQRALERKHGAAQRNATNKKYAQMRDRLVTERGDQSWARDKVLEVLLMHQQMETMELQKRQEAASAHRDHQRHVWSFMPFKARQLLDKSKRNPAPYFGSGPVHPDDMNESRRDPYFVWDANGRKHAPSAAEGLRREGAVQSALKIIRDVAQTNTVHGLDLKKPFRQFDRNGSGSLDRAELQSALQMMGVKLSGAQLEALMGHFDPDGSGEVDYAEFMWAFFNQRALLRDWKVHTQGKTARQIHELFYEHLKFGKALSKKQFKAALDKILKKEHTESEIELLLDQIDLDHDGTVNVSEFTAFMHALGGKEDEDKAEKAAAAGGGGGRVGRGATATSTARQGRREEATATSTRELNALLDTMLAQSRQLQDVLVGGPAVGR